MKRVLSYSLILTGFINPCLAINQPLSDDEALKIGIALSLAEEQRVIEEAAASAIPEMRRPNSVSKAVLAQVEKNEQLLRDAAVAKSLAQKETKTSFSSKSGAKPSIIPEMSRPNSLPKPSGSSSSSKSTQLEDDAALARKLQADLNAPAQSRGTSQEQQDADFAFALSLSVEKEPSKAKPMPSPLDPFYIPEVERPKLQTMVATYLQIRSNNKVAGLDVHAFNRAFVIPNREAVLAINKHLKLKEDNSLDAMITEFQTSNVNTPNLARALGMLKAYIANNRVDAETGLMLTQIISWNYELAKNVHRYSDNTLFCMPNGDHVSALNYMARSLDENINEKGGCLPGFMGRMFDVNFHFLCELAGVKIA